MTTMIAIPAKDPIAVWFSAAPIPDEARAVLESRGYEVRSLDPLMRPESGAHAWRLAVMTANADYAPFEADEPPALVAGDIPLNMLVDYLREACSVPLLQWQADAKVFKSVVTVEVITEDWPFADQEENDFRETMQVFASLDTELDPQPAVVNLADANGKPVLSMNADLIRMTEDGLTDEGAHHRAVSIARDLRRLGHWDGVCIIRIADPYRIFNALDNYVTLAYQHGELLVRWAQAPPAHRYHRGGLCRPFIKPL